MSRPGELLSVNETIPEGDSLLERAFRFAYFVLASREDALTTATTALSKLEIAVSAQDRRLYYQSRIRGPSKAWMAEAQLLQRLVMIESEPFERQRESAGSEQPLSADDAVVHFVKHVVRITMRRNAFYVTLGVSRLLHGYDTGETKEIHEVLAGEGSAMKGEDYFRSRKAVLLRELRERFGDALRLSRGPHGEQRFEIDESVPRPFVADCLAEMAPWDSACLPPVLEHVTKSESSHEVDRMHAVLHPVCYERVTRSLGLDPPASRLTVPKLLFANQHGNRPPGDRRDPPPLSPAERRTVLEELRVNAARRRRASGGLLRIDVNGQKAALLDPARESEARLRVGNDAEVVDVVSLGTEGEVALATCLLAHDEDDRIRPARLGVRLESGARILFQISPSSAPEVSETGGLVIVRYRGPAGPVVWFAEVRARLSRRSFFRMPLPAFVALFMALAAAFLIRSRPPSSVPIDLAPVPGTATAPAATPAPIGPTQPTPVPKPVAGEPRERERGGERAPGAIPLPGVRRVFIDMHAGGDVIRPRDALAARIQERVGWSPVNGREEADALLEVHVSGSPGEMTVEARLRDASGRVIWPSTGVPRRYPGPLPSAFERIAGDLDRAIRAVRTAPRGRLNPTR